MMLETLEPQCPDGRQGYKAGSRPVELPVADIIDWDIVNWSGCLAYWQPWVVRLNPDTSTILVLGDRNGGISLWLALQGFNVLCTDYKFSGNGPRELHKRWKVMSHITYAEVDVFKMSFPDNHFDMVACKSVIGGLKLEHKNASTRLLENQRLAVEEVRRVLKPSGIFLGAENLVGTRVHLKLRNIRHRGRLGWRYLQLSEIQWLFENYSVCQQKSWGFLGTGWPKSSGLNVICGFLDRCLSRVLPSTWLYISFIRARK